jgi:mono/diheme cytochrome c family protein
MNKLTNLLRLMTLQALAPLFFQAIVNAEECVPKSEVWNESKLSTILQPLNLTVIEVTNDPLFGGTVRYDGYQLTDVLTQAGISACSSQQITFKAKDGYTVKRPLHDFFPDKSSNTSAYLAIGEQGAKKDRPWRTLKEGREDVTPAPYALIWAGDHTTVSKDRPWPHMIVEIAFSAISEDPRSPGNDAPEAVKKGASLYTNNCSACHSINLSGGIIGPELNVPMNVTEYWSEPMLYQVINDPTSVRAGSRMPGYAHLPKADIESIVGYIRFMKNKKVCSDKASCVAVLPK